MRLQLTISLLVSDQIQAIRRCLDSLVPILMQIPSELIVVHTDEDTQIRDLVSQYTSHVIPFRWCGDFSKARNVGLQAAQGEWFMYIDDDEWLEDTDEIVDFFKSGEYLGYSSATYVVRNYTEWTGTHFVDAHLGRMVRRTPETKFINAVHEYISPFKSPTKVFTVYAHHYGYVRNVLSVKTDRNLPLLKKELEDHAPTAHNYLQMCQEYMSDLQYAEAEKYAFMCLELKEKNRMLDESWCLAYLPYLIRKQEDHQRALDVGKQMLRHPSCTEIAALHIYWDLIAICEKLGDHEKDIVIYAKAYHHGISRLDARPEQWFMQSIGGLHEHQSKSIKDMICLSGLTAAIQVNDAEAVKNFLQWLPWGDRQAEEIYPWLYSALNDKKNGDFLFGQFAELDIDDPFVFMTKARAAWKDDEIGLAREYHAAAVDSKSDLVFGEAIYLVLQSQGEISLEPWMGSRDVDQWRDISQHIADGAELERLTDWIKTAESYLSGFPIQALSILIALQKRLLVEGVMEISDQGLFAEMERYCSWIREYCSMVYNKDMLLSEQAELVPQEYRFALQMEEVSGYLNRTDYPKVLQGLRQAISIYQDLCGAIRRMLSVIREEMKRPGKVNREFEVLGVQVKEMIKKLLQEGRHMEAVPLIQQLSALLPEDLEVLRMRQEIYGGMDR